MAPAHRDSFSPVGKGFLIGMISEKTSFDSADIRNPFPASARTRGRSTRRWWISWLRLPLVRTPHPPKSLWRGLLAQKPWIVPIPGTRRLHRLSFRPSELTARPPTCCRGRLGRRFGAAGCCASGRKFNGRVHCEPHRGLSLTPACIVRSGLASYVAFHGSCCWTPP